MAYSTTAQVREETPFKNSTNISNDYISRLIDEADSLINSYVAKVYAMPLATIPKIINLLSRDLTAVFLFRDQNPSFEVQPGVGVEDMYNNVIATLESIKKREINLTDLDGVELALNGNTYPSFYPNTASNESLTNPTRPKFSMNKKF